MITNDSIVTFDLSYQQKDEKNYYIGNKNVNVFCEVPEEAVNVLHLFDGKRTINEVKQQCVEDVDVLDFAQNLEQMGLIYSINGEVIGASNEIVYSKRLQHIAANCFDKKRKYLYPILGVLAFLLLNIMKIMPSYESTMVNREYVGISFFIFFVVSCIITIMHELGHFLSGVYLRIPTSFKLSLRYFILVVEGDINGVWSVPKNQRYICYLSGMFFEAVIIFIAVVVKLLLHLEGVMKVCDIVIWVIMMNYMQQFMLFMRTDLYYVILNFLDLNGIYMYLNQLIFEKNKKNVYKKLPSKEKKYIKYFALISIVGVVMTLMYFTSITKVYYNFFVAAINEILYGNAIIIIDGACTLFVMLIGGFMWIMGLKSMQQERRRE